MIGLSKEERIIGVFCVRYNPAAPRSYIVNQQQHRDSYPERPRDSAARVRQMLERQEANEIPEKGAIAAAQLAPIVKEPTPQPTLTADTNTA